MVQKIGDVPTTPRTSESIADNKRESQKLEFQRRQVAKFERVRGQDGVQKTPPGLESLRAVLGAAGEQGAVVGAAPTLSSPPNASLLKTEVAQYFASLAELVVAEPPPGVQPAPRFTVDSKPSLRPQGRLELSPAATRQVTAFHAVVSGKEAGVIGRALIRVVDKSLAGIARGTDVPEQSTQLLQNAQVIVKALAPIIGPLKEFNKYGKITSPQKPGENPIDVSSAVESEDKAEGEASAEGGAAAQAEGAAPTQTPTPAKSVEQKSNVQRVDPIPGLQVGLSSAGISSMSDLLDNPNADIEMLVKMVLMEINQDQDNELREAMREMEQANAAKASQRKLQQVYRDSQLRLESEMGNEFNALKADGLIGDGVTLDEYKGWRQVVVGEPERDADGNLLLGVDGNPIISQPCLAQPSPPKNLPSFLTNDKQTDVDVKQAAEDAPLTQSGDAAFFGLTQDQVQMLRDFYSQFLSVEERTDWEAAGGFRAWAEGIGVAQVSSLEDVEANNAAITTWLNELNEGDAQGLAAISEDNVALIKDDVEAWQDAEDVVEAALDLIRDDKTIAKAYDLDPDVIKHWDDEELTNYILAFEAAKGTGMLQAKVDTRDAAADKVKHDAKYLYLDEAGLDALNNWQFFVKRDKYPEGVSFDGKRPHADQTADGDDINVLTKEQIHEWQAMEKACTGQLAGADIFSYNLDSAQAAVVQAMWDALPVSERVTTYGNDIGSFMKDKLGLKTPGEDGYDAAANASAITDHVANELKGATSDTDKQTWATLQEQLDFSSEGGFPTDHFGVSAAYGQAVEQMWLALPIAEREALGNDFLGFVAQLGVTPSMSEAQKQGIIRARMDALQATALPAKDIARLSSAEADLDLRDHPFDYGAFGLTPEVGGFLEEMWRTMVPEDKRNAFGNDINQWLEYSWGLDKSTGATEDNMDLIDARMTSGSMDDAAPPPHDSLYMHQNEAQLTEPVTSSSPIQGPTIKAPGHAPANAAQAKTPAFAEQDLGRSQFHLMMATPMQQLWQQAKTGTLPADPNSNAYIDQLIALGIIDVPKPPEENEMPNTNDPVTGDNTITGEKAQSIPGESDGRMMSLAELGGLQQAAKDKLDTMGEAGELVMLEIQLKSDRRSRTAELLSNLMKKFSNTSDAIISNMK